MKSDGLKNTGINKKFPLIISAVLIFSLALLPNAFAQDYTDISVSLDVDEGQSAELTLDGCWVNTAGTWGWSGNTISLLQPGDRENSGTGDQYTWYDAAGNSANGNILPVNNDAFAYGDCKFTFTIQNYSDYALQIYTDGDFDDGLGNQIWDMRNYDTTGFDFTLNSEVSGYPTGTDYGEHGFFLVNTDIPTNSILTDSTYDGSPTYSLPKKFNATDCNGGTRPCYHQYTTTGTYPKVIIDETAGNLTNTYFVVRSGMGADFSFPSGNYSMSITANLTTSP